MSFDFQCRLLFSDGPELVINTPFSLMTDGEDETIDPEDITSVVPVLGLLHEELRSMVVSDNGELSAEFASGVRIIVSPDEQYEAWQITHLDGRLAIALPGGGVTTFPARKIDAPSG